MKNVLLIISQILNFFITLYAEYKNSKDKKDTEARAAVIRSDPASAWLHKFGGTDKRTTSNKTSGSSNDTGSRTE